MFDPELLKAFFTLVVAVALLALAPHAIKKFSEKFRKKLPFDDGIEVLSRKSLTQKCAVFIVKVREKEYMLGVADQQVSLLCALENNAGSNTKTESKKTVNENLLPDAGDQQDISFSNFIKSLISKQ